MSLFNDLGLFLKDTFGEVQEGMVRTDRGHMSIDKEEGVEFKLRPKNKKVTKSKKITSTGTKGKRLNLENGYSERPIDMNDEDCIIEDTDGYNVDDKGLHSSKPNKKSTKKKTTSKK